MSDKDVDAQFAAIVAHWDDEVSPPERPERKPDPATGRGGMADRGAEGARDGSGSDASPRPVQEPSGDAAQDRAWDAGADVVDASEGATGPAPTPPSPSPSPSEGPGRTRPAVNPPLEPRPSPTNPPPIRPFVVWRGAEPSDDEPDDRPPELDDLDDDEHFEPGPLAPLPPQEDLQFWGIIVGLVAGPLLLLWLVLFRPQVSDWWTFGALGLTVGGFVLLVLRQPRDRDEDDPDNGARI